MTQEYKYLNYSSRRWLLITKFFASFNNLFRKQFMAVQPNQKPPVSKDRSHKRIMKVLKKKCKKKMIHILHTTVVMEKINGEPRFRTYQSFIMVKNINKRFIKEKIEFLEGKTIEEIKSRIPDKPIKSEFIKQEVEISKNQEVPTKKEYTRVPQIQMSPELPEYLEFAPMYHGWPYYPPPLLPYEFMYPPPPMGRF